METKNNITKEQKNLENQKEDLILIKRIIDDIFQTRHKIKDICEKHYLQVEKVKRLIYDTDFLDKNYGIGMKEKIKEKILENDSKRKQLPRNCILIEDRWDVFVANQNIHYLNEIDFRKLNIASSYLCSGANIDYVVNHHKIDIASALAILSDLKLESILKPVCYENLKRYIGIEKVLINNELSAKKTLLFNVVHVLNETNYDKQIALNYFNLPVFLFDKLLKEILILPFFDEDIKNNIKQILNEENMKKVK